VSKVQTTKLLVKAMVATFIGWLIGCFALSKLMGVIAGVVVATVIAGGGFLIWLAIRYPKAAKLAFDIVTDADDENWRGETSAEVRERQESERLGRDFLNKARRGDPGKST